MLIIGKLKTKGSFRDDREYPADELFDTVQFWVDGPELWRIRTFAVDHDIHIHQLEGEGEDPVQWAREHIVGLFEDVLAELITLEFDGRASSLAAMAVLAAKDLPGHIVQTAHGFAFWNPDDADYRTQSRPEG
jgi:hypothetical protein